MSVAVWGGDMAPSGGEGWFDVLDLDVGEQQE